VYDRVFNSEQIPECVSGKKTVLVFIIIAIINIIIIIIIIKRQIRENARPSNTLQTYVREKKARSKV